MKQILCDLYCRVSTTEQAAEGFSLGEQEARLRSFAQAQGWTVHAVYVDPGYSGAKLDRPGMQQLIRDVEQHLVHKVCTYKLDRLSRSQKDTLYLIEDVFLPNGVDYVSMTESLDTGSPFGMAMIGILSVFAQLEREQIAERMTMGRIASAKEGNWRGGSGVPIGYRYLPKTATEPGQLVIDPYEAELVREVFRLFLQGKTLHSIWAYCRERYTTAYGDFAGGGASRVTAMLTNRAYIGEIKYCGVWYPGKHEPIMDRETFDRAQAKLAEYRATLDDHRRKPFEVGHLLTGLLYCGECGARWCYHACSYKSRITGEKKYYGTYTCYTKNAHASQRRADRCSLPVWKSADLEAAVWEQVLALRWEDLERKPDPDRQKVHALEGRLDALEKQGARLADLYLIGTLPLDAVRVKADELHAEQERIREQIDAMTTASCRPSEDELRSALGRVQAIHDSGTLAEQRDLLRLLIDHIELHAGRTVVIHWNL